MLSGQPSRTAITAGNARAYHQNAEGPRIFTDPLSGVLVGNTGDGPRGSHPSPTGRGSGSDTAMRYWPAGAPFIGAGITRTGHKAFQQKSPTARWIKVGNKARPRGPGGAQLTPVRLQGTTGMTFSWSTRPAGWRSEDETGHDPDSCNSETNSGMHNLPSKMCVSRTRLPRSLNPMQRPRAATRGNS